MPARLGLFEGRAKKPLYGKMSGSPEPSSCLSLRTMRTKMLRRVVGSLFEEEAMANHSKERTRAEAQFKQTQKAQPAKQPATEGGQATEDYVAAGHAVRAKTARLKELRLAST